MIPLAIDREQIKQDIDALRMPLLTLLGGILGTALALAQIAYDFLVLDILYWVGNAIVVGAIILWLYDRYTVSEEAENPTKGDEG